MRCGNVLILCIWWTMSCGQSALNSQKSRTFQDAHHSTFDTTFEFELVVCTDTAICLFGSRRRGQKHQQGILNIGKMHGLTMVCYRRNAQGSNFTQASVWDLVKSVTLAKLISLSGGMK